jgi:hypothetical protein
MLVPLDRGTVGGTAPAASLEAPVVEYARHVPAVIFPPRRRAQMGLTPEELDRLEDYRQMMGPAAGSLALALDRLTDVMAMLGQHKVYCRVEKGPRAGEPPLDLREALDALETAKSLVRETLQSLRT